MQLPQADRDAAINVAYCDSVHAIDRADWERLLPGRGEDWTYFATIEAVPPPGFTLGAMVARRDGKTIAIAPAFRTTYRFDTALQSSPRARRIGDWLFRYAPRLVSMDMLSLGSPMTDRSHIGMDQALTPEERAMVVKAMLDTLRATARARKIPLISAKGLTTAEADADEGAYSKAGFARITTLPDVMLDLNHDNLEGYLASLPGSDRRYMRRKWRSLDVVRLEVRSDIEGIEDQINAMFNATLAQSKVDYGDFSKANDRYFSSLAKAMGPKARFVLAYVGDELLSFQVALIGDCELLAKGIGMHYPKARDHNLYFINWRDLIEYGIAQKIPRISMSGTTYATKLLLGGKLDQRWVFFRFSNPVLNALLPWLAPAFDYEKNDPELQAVRAGAAAKAKAAADNEETRLRPRDRLPAKDQAKDAPRPVGSQAISPRATSPGSATHDLTS